MLRHWIIVAILFFFLQIPVLSAGTWSAGIATTDITPENPLWMAGYAARERPSDGTAQPIYAKVLVLRDGSDQAHVLITTDLLGFSAEFATEIASRIEGQFGFSRSQVMLNASHTHSGPALTGVLEVAYRMSPEQWSDVHSYTEALIDKIVGAVGEATRKMHPARISYGRTKAPFAVNRRVKTSTGYVIGANRQGPVNHDVPFLTIDDERGQLKGVVFGYSCHNTTVRGDHYLVHGDYAGWAQSWLENRYPGLVAMFVTGTAGDANPYPRGTLELAREHGQSLAEAINDSLTGPLKPIEPPIHSAFETVELRFSRIPSRDELRLQEEHEDIFRRRQARVLLDRIEKDGGLRSDYPYPIQVWRFGSGLTLVGLAGEVVVDYTLRLRKELGSEGLWIAGYCNDVFAYVPSIRILEEGGYEPVESMIYYGQPSSFDPSIEGIIIERTKRMVNQLH